MLILLFFAGATALCTEIEPSVAKLRKAAQETDPTVRTYGEQMAQKVLALCDHYDTVVQPKLAACAGKIDAGQNFHCADGKVISKPAARTRQINTHQRFFLD